MNDDHAQSFIPTRYAMHLTPRLRRWLPWVLLTLALLATAIAYWPGRTGGWVFDDYPNIVDNDAIHILPGHATLAAWVNSALSSPSSFLHRPLASLSFSLNWYFTGADPYAFKVTNIAIHLLNGLLLYCVLRELLRLAARRWPQRIEAVAATRLALIVSAAWLVSPINLMAVLYVVQRMESLCQVFVLAGLWAYLRGRWMMLTANDDLVRDRRGMAIAVAGIVLGTAVGVTAKETAVMLPVYAFFAEAIVLRFQRSGVVRGVGDEPAPQAWLARLRTTDHRLWTLFTCTLFVPATLGFLWLLRRATGIGAFSTRGFTLVQRLITEPRVLVDYLHWTLLPNPAVLSLYHDEIAKSTGLLAPWTTLASIALLAALIALAVWLRNRRPLVALGIAWFFSAQLLTATIIPLELVFEQRMYFGSAGVLLALGALLLGLRWRIPHALPRVFLVVIALLWYPVATNLRAREWSNPVKLATAEAIRHPESPRANYTAAREWMIVAGYRQGEALDLAWKFVKRAAAIPGASALPDQALIMLVDHRHQGDDRPYWDAMIAKLRRQPTSQEDVSALISLSQCYEAKVCVFNVDDLQRAFTAALARPHPMIRLYGAYADFQRDIRHDDVVATQYLAMAVKGAPGTPAYRVDLAALYARNGYTKDALQQIDALRRLNSFGRLDRQIDALANLAEQGASGAAP